MKVTDHFAKSAGNTLVSFEVLPPLKGGSMQAIFRTLDALMEYKPPFIDVTYHREEYIYKVRPSGYYEKAAIRKRPGTVGICAAIMHRFKVDAVPHLICGGFSMDETENALIDLNFLGINNVLALRGDARQFARLGGGALLEQQAAVIDPDIEARGSRRTSCLIAVKAQLAARAAKGNIEITQIDTDMRDIARTEAN